MLITYREGRNEDADAAVALWREVEAELVGTGQHPLADEAEAIAMIGGSFRYLSPQEIAHSVQVVLVDGVLRGFGFLFHGHLYALYLGREVREAHHGMAILNALKTRHGARITLNVWSSNGRAVRFYTREGFHETKPEDKDPGIQDGQLRMTWTSDARLGAPFPSRRRSSAGQAPLASC